MSDITEIIDDNILQEMYFGWGHEKIRPQSAKLNKIYPLESKLETIAVPENQSKTPSWLKKWTQNSIVVGELRRWSARSSIHGFSHAGNSEGRKACYFWTLATVICSIGLFWFLGIRFNFYKNSGVVTSVEYQRVEELKLPDISICIKGLDKAQNISFYLDQLVD